MRYWVREKLPAVQWTARRAGGRIAELVRRVGGWLAELWLGRSRGTRIRIVAVAAVLALYSVVKFAAVPGVPCEVSAAKECPPADRAIDLVPADALLYAHLTLDRDSGQFERIDDIAEQLPDATGLARELGSVLPLPTGTAVDIGTQVLPWADRDLALARIAGPGDSAPSVFIVGVGDRAGAEQFLASVAPPGQSQPKKQEDASLDVYPGGFATAFAGDNLAFGDEPAVRAALDAEAGIAPGLEDSPQAEVRDEIPEVRFAEIYLSREGVQRLLKGAGTGATQLDTFVDYGATEGMAAGVTAGEDGVQLELASRLSPELLERSPTAFAELPEFEPSLTGEMGGRSLGYIGIGELGPTVSTLLEKAEAGAQGLAGSLRSLARRLQREAGVDPLAQLLPALGGQAALTAEPTDVVPFASLIVEGVHEALAREVLARLERPLLRSLRPGRGVPLPRVQEQDVEGVDVRSVQISPTVNLSYSIFDGMLVVSTDPAGIAQVRSGGESLADSDLYERAMDPLPDEVSALVFLNLQELLGLAEQAGLAADPLYASLSDDISKITSVGVAVTTEDEVLRTELFAALER